MLNRDLLIQHIKIDPETLDIQPRGEGCFPIPGMSHEFYLETHNCGFTYKICGRCGTVQISERRP